MIRPIPALLAAAALACAAWTAEAQQPAPSPTRVPGDQAVRAVDAALTRATAEGRFSGVVLMATRGTPVFQRAYGMADRERSIPNTMDTRFNLGSMNKMFTAVAIAQLVQEGRLSYQDPVSKYVPDFPTASAARKIRIEHLLTHTSGLGSYFSPRFFQEKPQTVAAILDVARQDTALGFEPGTGWRYSNTGFLLLGAIIEKVTGQDYYDYVRDHVFSAAGMEASSWPRDAGRAPERALEYVTPPEPGGAWRADEFHRGSPAGGGVSTAADLLRFSQALLGGRLVSDEQLRLMTTPKPELGSRSYGFGFGITSSPMRIVGHNGGKPGVFAQLDIYPEAGYTTVLLMNQGSGEPQDEFVELLRNAIRSMEGVPVPSVDGPSVPLPDTPAGRAAAALLETARGGDTAAIRRFVAERMGERFQARPLARNVALFQRMRGDLGDGRIVAAQPTATGIRLLIASPRGGFALVLGVEPAPPHRITDLSVEAGVDVSGGGDAPAAAPGAPATDSVLPGTPAGQAADALLQTVRAGDTTAIRRFVTERMDAQFNSRPMERNLALFRRMRDDFGDGRVVSSQATAKGIRVVVVSPRGRFTINLGVQTAAPYRIDDLSVEASAGGGDGPGDAAPAPTAPLDDATRRAVVDSVAALLARMYPSADTGRMIGERLRSRERAGAYAALPSVQAFTAAVTDDMRSLNGDRHLSLGLGRRRRAQPAPGGQPAQRADDDGIVESRVLEGNVGYLRLSELSGADSAPASLGRKLAALGDIRAMIIDLRGVPGGSGEMANAVISHFTGPDIPSLRVENRMEGTSEVRRTLAHVDGPRRTEIPLYVLVDRGSASAAEDVPFVLQNLGRATIVGEKTAGAGRNNRFVPVGAGLMASISWTRVSDPRTGREWEAVGIKPDIEVPSADALDAALRAAQERIARGRTTVSRGDTHDAERERPMRRPSTAPPPWVPTPGTEPRARPR
jgi:CubicO group peptidase (beta-lactamase class C family)